MMTINPLSKKTVSPPEKKWTRTKAKKFGPKFSFKIEASQTIEGNTKIIESLIRSKKKSSTIFSTKRWPQKRIKRMQDDKE